ncbi:unnamed protein product [Prorocentrum cordatum]|uniref:Uncharacterized protein n=1 Tax=Prorocentrum cordatum TaxID=2364126 RepID=A0ABN9QKZ8_9DINO|nr:unnamed protein product [Polarella glacialis]
MVVLSRGRVGRYAVLKSFGLMVVARLACTMLITDVIVLLTLFVVELGIQPAVVFRMGVLEIAVLAASVLLSLAVVLVLVGAASHEGVTTKADFTLQAGASGNQVLAEWRDHLDKFSARGNEVQFCRMQHLEVELARRLLLEPDLLGAIQASRCEKVERLQAAPDRQKWVATWAGCPSHATREPDVIGDEWHDMSGRLGGLGGGSDQTCAAQDLGDIQWAVWTNGGDGFKFQRDEAGARWINRPRDGQPYGPISTGGFAIDPMDPALARAGWEPVQVNEDGHLAAGCHGAAPREVAPVQTSRSGADCAINIATAGAYALTFGLAFRIDCSSALSCLNLPGLSAATDAAVLRPNTYAAAGLGAHPGLPAADARAASPVRRFVSAGAWPACAGHAAADAPWRAPGGEGHPAALGGSSSVQVPPLQGQQLHTGPRVPGFAPRPGSPGGADRALDVGADDVQIGFTAWAPGRAMTGGGGAATSRSSRCSDVFVEPRGSSTLGVPSGSAASPREGPNPSERPPET